MDSELDWDGAQAVAKRPPLAAALLALCLVLGAVQAMAQAQGAHSVEVCESFCAAAKSQCLQDLLGPGLVGLALALTLGKATEQPNAAIDALQKSRQLGADSNGLAFTPQEQCNKAHMQCKQDCLTPSTSELLPTQALEAPYAQPPAKDVPPGTINR